MTFSNKISILTAIFLIALFPACSTDSDEDEARYFEFTHQSGEINYTIVAKTSDPEVIANVEQELAKPFGQRNMHINGMIERGNPGYNDDWSWHFVEGQWNLAEMSAEVCDGRPGFVEENLDYWVDDVGRFCPWGARVEGEVNP